VRVRGTVQAPAHEPSFIILPITAVAPIEAAGGPVDVAVVFLAQHSWRPHGRTHRTPWSRRSVEGDAEQAVRSQSYGYAYLVDGAGERYGLEVDLKGQQASLAAGACPFS